jgi:hypothetical protein
MVTWAYAQTVTLISRTVTGQDAYGNDVYIETSTTVDGAYSPGGSTELVQGQDLLTVQPTVYLPSNVAPQSVDAVLIDGLRFDVDGDTDVWRSPFTGWSPGNVIRLKRVTG